MTINKEQPVSDAALKAGVKALKRNFLVQPHDYTVAQIYLAMKAASHPLEQQQAVSGERSLCGDVVEEAAFAMARVIAYRHGGNHRPDDWMSDERREEARAALTASGMGRMREALEDLPRLVELQRTAAPEDAFEDGRNTGLEFAANMIRTALQGGE